MTREPTVKCFYDSSSKKPRERIRCYLLCEVMDTNNRIFISCARKEIIAKEIRARVAEINKILFLFAKKDMAKRISKGAYLMNPYMVIKTTNKTKIERLRQEYDKL